MENLIKREASYEVFDALPPGVDAHRRDRRWARYLTRDAIEVARLNPGKVVKLSNRLVVEGTITRIRRQAAAIDSQISLHFVAVERRDYGYFGHLYLSYGAAVRAVAAPSVSDSHQSVDKNDSRLGRAGRRPKKILSATEASQARARLDAGEAIWRIARDLGATPYMVNRGIKDGHLSAA
ncbi:hypothetical protein [Microbacterium sp. UCD-TDU]|uniref:hypothetical protein n=1 Tax=Microbacterium sp. UCD-TDU TaxID=1247714 RepID=UPI0011819268|nr:hypothetical protein [Microbacterium sp. UCD-TDU]